MKSSVIRFLLVAVVMIAVSATAIDSGFQDYSSGYYTRGLDTALYLDQPSGIIDPFYVPAREWSVVPRLTLTVTWDDNLFLDSEDPQRAEIIDVIPGVLLIYGRPEKSYLYLDAGTILTLHDSTGNLEDRANYMLTLGSVYRTAKSTINLNGGYRRSENADTVIGERIVETDYIAEAGIEHQLTAKSSGGLLAGAEYSSYEDPELFDHQRHDVEARLYYKATEASDIFARASVGADDVDAPADQGDAEYVELGAGFRGKQSAKLTITGDVGYQWRTMKQDGREDVEHWTSTLGANYNPFGFTTLYGNIDTTVTPAINSLGQTTIDQRYTAGISRRLFVERLRGNASVFYGTYDYEGVPVDADSTNLDRSDDYFGYNLGLDYFTVHNLSLGLTFSYFENEGNQSGSAEERNRTAYDSGRWVLRASWNY